MMQTGPIDWIVETDDATFTRDVMDRSLLVPVVVDFWAAWCGPCRVLGPILEQLAQEYAGEFVLVKADTDRNPQAAAEFRVQSIPAVYGLRDGRIVDGFLGAMPEPQIRDWLKRFLPSTAEQLLNTGLGLLSSQPAEAEQLMREALRADSALAAARIALGRLLLDQKRIDEARAELHQLEERGFLEPDAERLKAALDLYDQGRVVGDVAVCRQALAQQPDDKSLKVQLARALAAQGEFVEALELCLEVVRQDRGSLREQARQTMVEIFRLLDDDDELVGSYRRKLSLALY
jgi:putative thioredoxin